MIVQPADISSDKQTFDMNNNNSVIPASVVAAATTTKSNMLIDSL